MKKLIIVMLFIIFITGCDKKIDKVEDKKEEIQQEEIKDITLNFENIEKVALREVIPSEQYTKVKTIYLKNLIENKDIPIQLYADKMEEKSNIFAFVQDNNKYYEIGNVSDFGLDAIGKIEPIDITKDNTYEILISGGLGATNIGFKIIDFVDNKWVMLLESSNIEFLDLDNDGTNELISSSRGSVPSYVLIYRYNGDNFEVADISKQTNNEYALIIYGENNEYKIETGTKNNPKFYKYERGKLIKEE